MAGYRRNSIAASLTSVDNRAGRMLLADSLPCFVQQQQGGGASNDVKSGDNQEGLRAF